MRPLAIPRARAGGAVLAMAAVVVPLLLQAPRDYLFNLGQTSSRFGGSRYASVLSRLGSPSDVVETDYLFSTALFTGHRTARTAFDAAMVACYPPGIEGGIAADHAGFLLLGDVNKPGVLDSPCMLEVAGSQPFAVRILSTTRDDASVFELIGPGTGHPDLVDRTAGSVPAVGRSAGAASLTWDWGRPLPVSQLSVGSAVLAGGRTAAVTLQMRSPDGIWETVASSASPVGDGRGDAPYLLATMRPGAVATAVRVVLSGDDPAHPVVTDVHALGPGAGR